MSSVTGATALHCLWLCILNLVAILLHFITAIFVHVGDAWCVGTLLTCIAMVRCTVWSHMFHVCKQGIENISVQSSVSLQHLPYDKELEKNVEASIAGRLSFATQKLAEIVKAAKDAPALKDDQIKAGLPDVGVLLYRSCIHT